MSDPMLGAGVNYKAFQAEDEEGCRMGENDMIMPM